MSSVKKDVKRNRTKRVDLKGLYAVPHEIAYEKGKPRPGVYGYVTRRSPYICRAQKMGDKKPPAFLQDMTGEKVPTVMKNRILAFWGDSNNMYKQSCYLVERSLYEEMMEAHKPAAKKPIKKGSRK